jgi:hypothetical protein
MWAGSFDCVPIERPAGPAGSNAVAVAVWAARGPRTDCLAPHCILIACTSHLNGMWGVGNRGAGATGQSVTALGCANGSSPSELARGLLDSPQPSSTSLSVCMISAYLMIRCGRPRFAGSSADGAADSCAEARSAEQLPWSLTTLVSAGLEGLVAARARAGV